MGPCMSASGFNGFALIADVDGLCIAIVKKKRWQDQSDLLELKDTLWHLLMTL